MTTHRRIDLVGQRFGRLVVIGSIQSKRSNARWLCRCDCGAESNEVYSHNLRSGAVRSCGCLNREILTTHGHASIGKHSPTYRSWRSMHGRCDSPSGRVLKNYGGRGIRVCGRWARFENFLADMLERPAGTSIDRIDNDGNYKPNNCRWATRSEQNMNQRSRVAKRVAE